MKKKQWVLTGLFFAAMLLLPVSFLCNIWFSLDAGQATYLQEKRELEELPSLADGISTWPSQIEEYLQDHLPFRGTLTYWDANINYTLFHSTTSEQVILGKGDWMFFADYDDVTNISDYQGVLTLSEEECVQMAETLTTFADEQAAQGRQTVLFIVPNKEQIYGQYLPDGIVQINSVSRTDTLLAYLGTQASSLLLADPKPILLEMAQEDDGLYYMSDSHWTPAGCYLGLQCLLGTLGIALDDYNPEDYIFMGECVSGDIASMSGLFSIESEEIYRAENDYSGTITGSVADYCTSLEIYKSEADDTQRVLVLGDSFRDEMKNQMSFYYAEVGYLDITLATAEIIDQFDPDIIVIEQVERNIAQLGVPIV